MIEMNNITITEQDFIDDFVEEMYSFGDFHRLRPFKEEDYSKGEVNYDYHRWEKSVIDYVIHVKMFMRTHKIKRPRWITYCQDTAAKIINAFEEKYREECKCDNGKG